MITSQSQVTGLTHTIMQLKNLEYTFHGTADPRVTLVLLLLHGCQRRVAISMIHHLIVSVVIFKPIIVFFTHIDAISINIRLFAAKKIGKMIGIMHIAAVNAVALMRPSSSTLAWDLKP
jgi:hypothetical protein